MTEWGVVGVIVTLLGLGVTVIKPIISLTNAITRLTVIVDSLQQDIGSFTIKNTDSHKRLWDHNEEQDAQLNNHEGRIIKLEHKKETRK